MRKRLIIATLITGAVAAGFGFYRWSSRSGDGRIILSGNIELTEVNVSFKLPGKLVERAVDEGERVKRGMVVARLDQQQLLQQRDQATAAVSAAQSRLAQLSTAIRFQTANLVGMLDQRRAELRQAAANLEALTSGSRIQDIEQARARVEAARTAEEKARKDWVRAQELIRNEDISAAEFDRYKTAFEAATADFKQAEERYSLVKEGPRKEDIEAGRAAVARAQANVRLAEAMDLDIKRANQERSMRQAEIEQARAAVSVMDTQLADTVALSPIDGVVLTKAAEPGEVIAAGTTVLTIGDLDHPWVRAYIEEPDLGRVKIGAKAKVTTDSFPGKAYWGRVSFISSEAEFTPKQIQTREERVKLVYRIKVDVENPNHELKSNMPADVELIVE